MYQIKLNKDQKSITLKKVNRSVKLYQTGRRGPQGIQGIQGPPGSDADALVTSVNTQQGDVVLDTDDIQDTSDNRYTNDADIDRLADTSGENTGDQDLSSFETTTQLNARDTANRSRTNHTGTQPAATISDFDAEVANNTDVAANTAHRGRTDNPHATTKAQVGLANVDNTSDADKPISDDTQTALDDKEDTANKGTAGGYAELDGSGLVPTSQLPSYVDDVVEVANFAALPGTGVTGKIYVTLDDNKTYRWGGSAYAEINASLALGETSSTAYRGDRGKAAYDHSQLTSGNPHNVTKSDVGLSNVDNTSDVSKPISTATQSALDTKAPFASPALTGTPTAPTASSGTSTTQLATTAYVEGEIVANDKSRTATKTVGIAPQVADYICDGTDDNVEINAAITAVNSAGGGIVHLRAGTYNPSLNINLLSNITLQGEGYSTLINVPTTKQILISGKTNVVVKDLRVDALGQVTNDVAIDIKNSSDIVVKNVTGTNFTGFGIFVESTGSSTSERILIDSCTLAGLGNNDLIGGGPANSTGASVTDVNVVNCNITQDCTTGTYQNALAIVKATRLSVINNYFRGNCVLSVEQWPHFFTKIQNNFVRPALTKSAGSITVNTTSSSTTSAEGLIIAGNDIQQGQISLVGVSAAPIKRSIVANNHITQGSSQSGILLTWCDRINCFGNIIAGSAGGAFSGIRLATTIQTEIQANIISGYDYGVNDISSDTTITVTNNHLYTIGVSAIISAGTVRNNYGATPTTMYGVAEGGTGASTASAARTNLGLEIGTDVQAWDADLDTWATKTAPSGTPVGTIDTQTLTNKRVTPRVGTVTSSATPTINTDNVDAFSITALATAITSMTTNLSGTPGNFQKLTIRIKDDGTARAITWGASFVSRGATLPTTTVISKVLTVGFIYNSVASTWDCVAVAQEA